MNITKLKSCEQGFILYITLIMLIIFAIVGMSLYQQTSSVTATVQYVSFKQEAEDLALRAIDYLETNIEGTVTIWNNTSGDKNRQCYQYTPPANNPTQLESDKAKADRLFACNAIPTAMVDSAISSLKSRTPPSDYTPTYIDSADGGRLKNGESSGSWEKLKDVTGFSSNGSAYYIIQDLGLSDDTNYRLYRITVLTELLDSYSSMDSIYALAQPTT